MCGIAGFFGDYDGRYLSVMSSLIKHRGPDDEGVYFAERDRVGLVHRRLSIIDLSPAGHQPMWDVDGLIGIVFNGEIYNYRELAHELIAQGFRFRGGSDTEVIVNLYKRDGVAAFAKLDGMFAFALWDRSKRVMYVARDFAGVKPLYICEGRRGFAFSSELKALACLPGFDSGLDFLAMRSYVGFLYSPGERTPFLNVKKLAPGTFLTISDGVVVGKTRFSNLPLAAVQTRGSFYETVEELDHLLSKAVRKQMIADVPVGAFLSGGLDSSSLVALARRYSKGGQIQCFTSANQGDDGVQEGFPDDLSYARKVAEHLSVPLNVIWSSPDVASRFEDMVYQLDEPQPDPAALHVYEIAKSASAMGVKVLLSGSGGDDIFSGYRRHQALNLEKYWSWWPQIIRSGLAFATSGIRISSPVGRRVGKAFRNAGQDHVSRLAGYFSWLPNGSVEDLFCSNVKAEFAGKPFLQPILDAIFALPQGVSSLDAMLNIEQRFFLPDHNLNYTDKMAMAAGVEVRVPFLDRDLMNFASSLPVNMKQRGLVGKWLLKRAMEVYLPRDVIYRPKAGFGVPLRSWMRKELRQHFEHSLSESTIKSRGIFDHRMVRRLWDADKEGRIDAAYSLFGIVCIEAWCRRFLDQRLVINLDDFSI